MIPSGLYSNLHSNLSEAPKRETEGMVSCFRRTRAAEDGWMSLKLTGDVAPS